MQLKTKWPKRQPVKDYIALNYTADGIKSATVIKQIKNALLPGIKFGGKWYVYVLPDGSPAYGYTEKAEPPTERQDSVKLTGNSIADAILAKTAANNGLRVTR